MLNVILLVLLALWTLGMVSSYTMGGFIHLLLFLAIAVVLDSRDPGSPGHSLMGLPGDDSRSAAGRAPAAGSSADTAGGSGAPGDPARAADRAPHQGAPGPGPRMISHHSASASHRGAWARNELRTSSDRCILRLAARFADISAIRSVAPSSATGT